jgi:hypothetical protein
MGGWERGDGMYKRYGVVYYIINGLSSDTPFGGLGGRVASMYGAGEYVEMTIKFAVEPCSSGSNTRPHGLDPESNRYSMFQHFFVPPFLKASRSGLFLIHAHLFFVCLFPPKRMSSLYTAPAPEKVYIDSCSYFLGFSRGEGPLSTLSLWSFVYARFSVNIFCKVSRHGSGLRLWCIGLLSHTLLEGHFKALHILTNGLQQGKNS